METETYKVAKEILEKFDPNRKLVEVIFLISRYPILKRILRLKFV